MLSIHASLVAAMLFGAPVDTAGSRIDPVSCAFDAAANQDAADASATVIPELTPVTIRIATALDSKTALIGACFPIALAEPITIDGAEVVPAGAKGLGQVVHAAKARAGGKGGELILAGRFIEHNGVRIGLRSLEFSKAGKDQLDAALVASAALPLAGYLFSGGNVWVAEGALAFAKVRKTVRVSRAGSEQRDDVNAIEGEGEQ